MKKVSQKEEEKKEKVLFQGIKNRKPRYSTLLHHFRATSPEVVHSSSSLLLQNSYEDKCERKLLSSVRSLKSLLTFSTRWSGML